MPTQTNHNLDTDDSPRTSPQPIGDSVAKAIEAQFPLGIDDFACGAWDQLIGASADCASRPRDVTEIICAAT